MKSILDAGPLIASLNREDAFRRWACQTAEHAGPPFSSCPEAMAEAAAMTGQPAAIVEIIQAGGIILAFNLADQSAAALAAKRRASFGRSTNSLQPCCMFMLVREKSKLQIRLLPLCQRLLRRPLNNSICGPLKKS